MGWPLSQEYNEAIQSPQTSFADSELRQGEAVTNALGIPMPRSGNFADVYEIRCPNGSRWAVKCFTREVPGLRDRYQEISDSLRQAKLPFTVDFTYQEQGIRIRNDWFPVLKMQWVEGFTLNEFVRQHLDKPAMLGALLQIWSRMGARLRSAGIAHADLQHGNVLLVPGTTATSVAAKLIDYDGMFVPSFQGKKSGEVGHPCYQHPQRLREGTFNPEVDRFPLLLIATSLRCLEASGRSLWERHDNGDNLLFLETDLKAPRESTVFRELKSLDDPGARTLADLLYKALDNRLEAVPLLDEVLSGLKPVAQAPPEIVLAPIVPPPVRAPQVLLKPKAETSTPLAPKTRIAPTAADDDDEEPEDEVLEKRGRRTRRPRKRRQKTAGGLALFLALGGVAALVVFAIVAGVGVW
jgi:hypothetical protein